LLLLALALAAFAAPEKPKFDPNLPPKTKIFRMVTDDFFEENCYFIVGPTGKTIIIDPGDNLKMIGENLFQRTDRDAKRIYKFLTENKLDLQYMIITHGHLDHIGSVKFLKERIPGARILMHAADVRKPGDPLAGQPKDANIIEGGLVKVDRTIDEGELTLGDMSFKVLYTPGHGRGSICLFSHWNGKPVLFSGDTLLHFYKAWDGTYYDTGRTNFKDGTGDQEELYRMLREKLFILPDETLVFPGHYDYTTIGLEKFYSPALAVPGRPVDIPKPEEPLGADEDE
jgi:glyoxylase-like metal-dependent hydrolase (beta-lactamase superfamily II)